MTLRPAEVSGSLTIAVGDEDRERLLGFMGGHRGMHLRVERRIHRPGARCLWGSARRIQVGSREDEDDVLTLDVPEARVEVTGP